MIATVLTKSVTSWCVCNKMSQPFFLLFVRKELTDIAVPWEAQTRSYKCFCCISIDETSIRSLRIEISVYFFKFPGQRASPLGVPLKEWWGGTVGLQTEKLRKETISAVRLPKCRRWEGHFGRWSVFVNVTDQKVFIKSFRPTISHIKTIYGQIDCRLTWNTSSTEIAGTTLSLERTDMLNCAWD